MKQLVATFLFALVSSAGVSVAQEPTSRENERVVHLPAARVGGTHHRAAPLILPPPANVYERATRRERAREPGAPGAHRIRRDL